MIPAAERLPSWRRAEPPAQQSANMTGQAFAPALEALALSNAHERPVIIAAERLVALSVSSL
jgi:hypothetical protein